jgi:hypothetical protein
MQVRWQSDYSASGFAIRKKPFAVIAFHDNPMRPRTLHSFSYSIASKKPFW